MLQHANNACPDEELCKDVVSRKKRVASKTLSNSVAVRPAQLASSACVPSAPLSLRPVCSDSSNDDERILIGVARDAAFSFYYHEWVFV